MESRTITGILDDLAGGRYSSTELTQAFLDEIKRCDSLGAYITVFEEEALAAAAQADEARARKETGLLTGVPIAHKDIFCTS
ncbi:MAG: Asp-tRNA(Asn)/Glu-tRNA(Gln) amidotransferase GatCAB subunit A, partial [Pseudomonadales bacterium]|nr:Asp-tRNA(Asn)/Glu-tRNA(Gln) amidotransferase GatCAB subunit A [Pseudomonadales bacterium]